MYNDKDEISVYIMIDKTYINATNINATVDY